jgi:hypothetical protein
LFSLSPALPAATRATACSLTVGSQYFDGIVSVLFVCLFSFFGNGERRKEKRMRETEEE